MNLEVGDARRIIITGDAGSGKTTLATVLYQRLSLPMYSTDDALWEKRFTVHRDRSQAVEIMHGIYLTDTWIVEGTTRQLLNEGFSQADLVIYIGFSSVIRQLLALLQRHFHPAYDEAERWRDLFGLMIHVVKKRYRLGKERQGKTLLALAKEAKRCIVVEAPISEKIMEI